MDIFGCDTGFLQVKAVAKNWSKKFPSLVKVAPSTEIDAFDDTDGYSLSYGGRKWRVGARGSYDFTSERMSKDTDIPKLLAAFGLYKPTMSIDTLLLGLPIEDYNTYRTILRENLEGKEFQYTLGKTSCFTRIGKVIIIPQSAGAFYDLILDEYGEVANEDLASEVVLTLDIGGKTSDVCIMEQGRYNQESFTVFRGVWKLHEQLRKLVMKSYRYALKPFEVDNVARTGALKFGGDVVPCQILVDEAIEATFPELRDELTLHIDDFRRFGAVVLTGGGAHLYREKFSELFNGVAPVTVSEDVEFANAKGYYKYGLLRALNRQ